jgi:hypothetical protein
MNPVARKISHAMVVLGTSLGAGYCLAAPEPTAPPESEVASQPEGWAGKKASNTPDLTREQGMVMLDYEVIPVPGLKPIDLTGFHFFNKFNNGLYLGVGGYAPLLKGEYGGFMTFDVSAHVQRPIHGRLFAAAGVSLGGGGGGKSAEQSKALSGTGGYVKGYAGLGYAFDDFSIGANIARFRFSGSAIGHTQPNLFVQVPFSYTVGSYASSGLRYSSAEGSDADGPPAESGESSIRLGLDNYKQIDPKGSNKGSINLVNLQYSRFYSSNNYWFFDVGLGYRGLPLYNQIVAGIGRRVQVAPRVNLYGQLGLGSGGYAPDTIDTGPGLLAYPKVSAEVLLTRNLGLSMSAGYLAAPRGSSRNVTLGAALNYQINPGPAGPGAGDAAGETQLRGYRFNLLQQTEFDVRVANRTPAHIRMLTMQIDMLVDDSLYIPVQGSVATNAYVGYPGYGEVLVGAGLQSKYSTDDSFQFFGQLLAGPNVHGLVLKPQLGVNIGLSDRLALHAQAGRTIGIGNYGQNSNKQRFRANAVGIGLTYRFSVPSR